MKTRELLRGLMLAVVTGASVAAAPWAGNNGVLVAAVTTVDSLRAVDGRAVTSLGSPVVFEHAAPVLAVVVSDLVNAV